MGRHCTHCQRPLDDDAQFCPGCGAKVISAQGWKCAACQQENLSDAQFCKKCGAGLARQMVAATTPPPIDKVPSVPQRATPRPVLKPIEKIKEFVLTHPHGKLIAGIATCCLLLLIGGYFYFSFANERTYLANYADAARQISDANEVLAGSIAPDKLKANPLNMTKDQIQQQKDLLDKLQQRFETKKGPSKYAEQHQYMVELLKAETALFQEAALIMTNPLNAETDNLLAMTKTNIEGAKNAAVKIQMPDATITISSQMSVVPNQLTIYVEEQRKANKEKMDRLTAMNEFFGKTDAIIQKYTSAKSDLGGMLENLRKGGYTWFDYFSALQQARDLRVSLRTQVNNLSAPKGAEPIKQQLSDVLTQAINYCDLMNAAANVEYNTNYHNAQQRYQAAQAADSNVQTSYTNFINFYQAEKTRLTNINNL